MPVTQVLDYLTAHPWAGWLLLGAISLLLAKKSQVDAWAATNPRAAGVMKLLRGLGVDPFLLLQGLSLLIRKRLPEPPKVKLPAPKDDVPPTPRTGSVPPTAALVLLFALGVAPELTGCNGAGTSSTVPEGTPPAAVVVPGAAALAYNGAAAALLYFDMQEAAYIRTLDSSKTAELDAAEHRVQTLEHARAALKIAEGWLRGQHTGEEGRAGVRDGVHVLRLIAKELANQGRPLPKEVNAGLALAEAWLVTP